MKSRIMLSTIFLSVIFFFTQCERAVATNNFAVNTELKTNGLNAKVIRIIDGDTFEVMYGELPVMIRLAHIDCPEKKQAFGTKAKQVLSDLCFGKEIEIEYREKDRNGRYICVIYNLNGTNINKEMVRLGMAWHFKKYSNDDSYSELENQARKNKIGLWKDQNPIAPWEWRK